MDFELAPTWSFRFLSETGEPMILTLAFAALAFSFLGIRREVSTIVAVVFGAAAVLMH